jgi:hypothetical protein
MIGLTQQSRMIVEETMRQPFRGKDQLPVDWVRQRVKYTAGQRPGQSLVRDPTYSISYTCWSSIGLTQRKFSRIRYAFFTSLLVRGCCDYCDC